LSRRRSAQGPRPPGGVSRRTAAGGRRNAEAQRRDPAHAGVVRAPRREVWLNRYCVGDLAAPPAPHRAQPPRHRRL